MNHWKENGQSAFFFFPVAASCADDGHRYKAEKLANDIFFDFNGFYFLQRNSDFLFFFNFPLNHQFLLFFYDLKVRVSKHHARDAENPGDK